MRFMEIPPICFVVRKPSLLPHHIAPAPRFLPLKPFTKADPQTKARSLHQGRSFTKVEGRSWVFWSQQYCTKETSDTDVGKSTRFIRIPPICFLVMKPPPPPPPIAPAPRFLPFRPFTNAVPRREAFRALSFDWWTRNAFSEAAREPIGSAHHEQHLLWSRTSTVYKMTTQLHGNYLDIRETNGMFYETV